MTTDHEEEEEDDSDDDDWGEEQGSDSNVFDLNEGSNAKSVADLKTTAAAKASMNRFSPFVSSGAEGGGRGRRQCRAGTCVPVQAYQKRIR